MIASCVRIDERAERGLADERHVAGDGLDEHEAERVEVGAPVEPARGALLRRRVARGAEHRARRLGPARLGERAGEAEVGDAHDAVLVEEEVGRLDVAVHEPAAVRVLERRGDLAADVRGLRRREPDAGVEHPAQRAALEQLEDHERDAVVLAPVVDGHDVRVVQRRRELGLGAEPAQEARVVRKARVEDLDRDASAQPDVVRGIDAAARACTDRAEQAVAAGKNPADEVGHRAAGHRIHGIGPDAVSTGHPMRTGGRRGGTVAARDCPEHALRPSPQGHRAPRPVRDRRRRAHARGAARSPARSHSADTKDRAHRAAEPGPVGVAEAGRDRAAPGADHRRPARRPHRRPRALRPDPVGGILHRAARRTRSSSSPRSASSPSGPGRARRSRPTSPARTG